MMKLYTILGCEVLALKSSQLADTSSWLKTKRAAIIEAQRVPILNSRKAACRIPSASAIFGTQGVPIKLENTPRPTKINGGHRKFLYKQLCVILPVPHREDLIIGGIRSSYKKVWPNGPVDILLAPKRREEQYEVLENIPEAKKTQEGIEARGKGLFNL